MGVVQVQSEDATDNVRTAKRPIPFAQRIPQIPPLQTVTAARIRIKNITSQAKELILKVWPY